METNPIYSSLLENSRKIKIEIEANKYMYSYRGGFVDRQTPITSIFFSNTCHIKPNVIAATNWVVLLEPYHFNV